MGFLFCHCFFHFASSFSSSLSFFSFGFLFLLHWTKCFKRMDSFAVNHLKCTLDDKAFVLLCALLKKVSTPNWYISYLSLSLSLLGFSNFLCVYMYVRSFIFTSLLRYTNEEQKNCNNFSSFCP